MSVKFSLDLFVDRANNSLQMKRKFSANRQLVWDCYTKSEYLDQWYAPEPLIARTKSIDFRPGGHWHYAMVTPDNTENWNYIEFITIKPIDFYTTIENFSNEIGEIDKGLPSAECRIDFIDEGVELTMVETVIKYSSLSDLETVIEMGIENGLKLAFDNLEELLESLFIRK